ncbi:DUF1223 domain-containing protein [Microvirga sp. CF3062]|uniref:DUF1223 domain-containing protein n=1 Tax=Microvirga sp. CF3062 TaxID=3110182 RepID=UPI002E7A016A|nr:DUF1223 domain-containing protein [Microvirga sp. CF3062]MEE1657872.1 DUF1223 domain-containing protein [Microvirga sp. CF3062]
MRHRLKSWLGLLPFASILMAAPATASPEPHAVLELFVSQGCSACRPANELMAELARDPGLVVLSLPVNYWDYMGWKDTLADPQFTVRQKGYALARGVRRVYTPELVVSGFLSSVGSARDQVMGAIHHATHGQAPVPVDVREEDGMIMVDVGEGAGDATAWLLPVRRKIEVPIHRGENAGKTETYVNVVRGLIFLGPWSGAPASFRVPLEAIAVQEADAYVVLLQQSQDEKPGRIIGAAKGSGL